MQEIMPTVLKYIKRTKITLLIILLFTVASAPAQDTLAGHKGIIYQKWPRYTMDGKKLNDKSLKQELYTVPAAIPYYKNIKPVSS
jgi:hypothetical protein